MVKGTVISGQNQAIVKFDAAPAYHVRQTLKGWRFTFDGTQWTRRNDLTWGRFLDELERCDVQWQFFVERDGKLLPARVQREYMRSPKLVVDETAQVSETTEQPSANDERVIRARRCVECGSLFALQAADQAELIRRQRAAVERAIEELQARGEAPFLAAAPVPENVEIVGHVTCRFCRES
jgi:hypothetical protein